MNFTKLNQKIILKTGVFGIFMGLATVLGWCQEYELAIWIFMGIATSIYLNSQLKEFIFTHCIVVGLTWGFDCSLIQTIFIDTYISNNPIIGYEILDITKYPRILIITIGTTSGLLSGIALYLPIILLRKIKEID
jgi:hypothetical protein